MDAKELRRPSRPGLVHQPLPLPAGAFRHSAALARRPGQVDRRHRPQVGDQGDPGHPRRGRRTADKPAAEREVGWLATTVTLLRLPRKGHPPRLPSVHQAVEKLAHPVPRRRTVPGRRQDRRDPPDSRQPAVRCSKRRRLMHPAIDAASMADRSRGQSMASEGPIVPLGRKGRLASILQREAERRGAGTRADLRPRTPDARLQRGAPRNLRSASQRSPPWNLVRHLRPEAPLTAGQLVSLAGEGRRSRPSWRSPNPRYDARMRACSTNPGKGPKPSIYLLGARGARGRRSRSQRSIAANALSNLHRNDPDQEVKEYCASQTERAGRLIGELGKKSAAA